MGDATGGEAYRPTELERIQDWIDGGLLRNVDQGILNGRCKEGSIVLLCGDGDKSFDKIFKHLIEKLGLSKRVHLEAVNGGAFRLIEDAPIPNNQRIHQQLLAELHQSRELKQISNLLLYAHYPCGMAIASGIDLSQTIEYTLQASQLLVRTGWDAKSIVPLFHVDHGTKLRTYYIEKTMRHLLNAA